MPLTSMHRRHFVKGALGLAASISLSQYATAAPKEVPQRLLGRTGAKVSALGLGGFHLSVPSEKEAIALVRRAIDGGITFIDNCWDYADGESERRAGKALRNGYRERAFLMTKIDGRRRQVREVQIQPDVRRHLPQPRLARLTRPVIRAAAPWEPRLVT